MINNKIIVIFIALLISGCGFKAVNQEYLNQYKIIELNIKGDARLSYLLKNKLKLNNEKSDKSIKLSVIIDKTKNIREKNIKNEITKYQISITVKTDYYLIEENKSGNFLLSVTGDHNVGSRYRETLNNEKKLINSLMADISEQLFRDLLINLNDL
jgi:outer membrane lipopolysaccharide assembly protein LptE/RlpB